MTRSRASLTIASGVTLPGADAQHLAQQLGPAEGEAGGAQELGQPVEVDPLLVQAGDQPEPVLLVLEEQVLAVAAGQVVGMEPAPPRP